MKTVAYLITFREQAFTLFHGAAGRTRPLTGVQISSNRDGMALTISVLPTL